MREMTQPVGLLRRACARVCCLALLAAFSTTIARAADGEHGIAMHGVPALAAGFQHFPYADPSAAKGGRITLGALGTFDSLNPHIIRGVTPFMIAQLIVLALLVFFPILVTGPARWFGG